MKTYLLFLLFISNYLFGTHIVGGEITYKYIGTNINGFEYEISMDFYRDCNSTDFESNIHISFFDASTNLEIKNLVIPLTSRTIIPITAYNPCVVPPTSLCYEKANYTKRVVLPPSVNGYNLSWQRCCRNPGIKNIVKSEDYGITLNTLIPNTALQNNSAFFNSTLPSYICMGDTFVYSQSATDIDGDSLVYALTTPTHGASLTNLVPIVSIPPPYPSCIFQAPFNLSNLLGGTPLTINPSTGVLTAIPNTIGQFVFAISVYEYRNGNLINQVKREVQLNVLSCQPNLAPIITLNRNSPQIQGDTITFIEGQNNCFPVLVKDLNVNDSVFVSGVGLPFNNSSSNAVLNDSTKGVVTTTLCWQPDCDQIGMFTPFKIFVRDDFKCPSPNLDSMTLYAKVVPGIPSPPQLRCVSTFDNNTINLSWIPTPNFLGFANYQIQRNDGSGWINISSINSISTTTFSDLNALNAGSTQYCYRIAVYKNCNGIIVADTGDVVCSMVLTHSNINPTTETISWSNYTGWVNPVYTLYSNEGSFQITASNLTTTTYELIKCTFNGSVRIKTIDPLTNCEVYSMESDIFILSNVPPSPQSLCNVSVDVSNSGINISWIANLDQIKSYEIWRSDSSKTNFTKIFATTALNYLDESVNVNDQSYCYFVKAIDECDLVEISETMCSIVLSSSSFPYQVDLNWRVFDSNYTILTYDLQENLENSKIDFVNLQNLNDQTFSYSDINVDKSKGFYCYRIKAITDNSCENFTYSNIRCETFPVLIFFPTAFSPNGDGLNEIFNVKGEFIEKLILKIYNRWGKLIYEVNDVNQGWNGTSKGKNAPEGVYVFHINATGFDGKVIDKIGSVTLIR